MDSLVQRHFGYFFPWPLAYDLMARICNENHVFYPDAALCIRRAVKRFQSDCRVSFQLSWPFQRSRPPKERRFVETQTQSVAHVHPESGQSVVVRPDVRRLVSPETRLVGPAPDYVRSGRAGFDLLLCFVKPVVDSRVGLLDLLRGWADTESPVVAGTVTKETKIEEICVDQISRAYSPARCLCCVVFWPRVRARHDKPSADS